MSTTLEELTGFGTIFGREEYPDDTATIVRVIKREGMPNAVAAIKFVYELKTRYNVARHREYLPPNDVDTLDGTFSDGEIGSVPYRKAKSLLFDINAPKPGSARRVTLNDGKEATVRDYRPWLSHWLIRGLASISGREERLRNAGIVPGKDLEDKLAYRSGDFSSEQYSVMATVLENMIALYCHFEGTPYKKEATIRGYLTGKHVAPLLGDWELLKVLGIINEEIAKAHSSKNKEQFQNQEGFYWAIRHWDVWRSAFRKHHIIAFDAKDAASNKDWDHISVADMYRQLARGIVEPIDDKYDWVKIGNVSKVRTLSNLARESTGMFIYRNGGALPQNVIALTPKDLWMHYDTLTEILIGLMGEYLKRKGQHIVPNEAQLIINPASGAITAFISTHGNMAMSYNSHDTSKNQKIPGFTEEQVIKSKELANMIINAICDGNFEKELNLPKETALDIIETIASLGTHASQEYAKFHDLTRRIEMIDAVLSHGPSNINKAFYQKVFLESIGLLEPSNRGLKRVRDRFREEVRRYERVYRQMYGESPIIDLSQITNLDLYESVLSTYGFTSVVEYAYLAPKGITPIIKRPNIPLVEGRNLVRMPIAGNMVALRR